MKAKEAISNTPHLSNKKAHQAIDLRSDSNWFTTNDNVQEKTLRIELDGEFYIVMMYVVAKNLRQFKLELGKFVC